VGWGGSREVGNSVEGAERFKRLVISAHNLLSALGNKSSGKQDLRDYRELRDIKQDLRDYRASHTSGITEPVEEQLRRRVRHTVTLSNFALRLPQLFLYATTEL